MRKILSSIVCVCLCAVLLASCGLIADNPSEGTGGSTGQYGGADCEHRDDDGNGICDLCHRDIGGDCVHTDTDNDGRCDGCNISVVVELDLFAINDLHGMYAASDQQPGVGGLTTYLLDAQKNGNTIVLSTGDMWQGSTESNNTKGKLATEWMNYVNCASMTLGNHEFDWSTSHIAQNSELAEFPFLAINVFDRETDRRVTYCDASVMVEKDGAKIGIIGAIGDCYSSISSSMCSDVYFKVGDELTELVKNEAERLRALGADYVVYSVHDGYAGKTSSLKYIGDTDLTWYDPELSNGYVDVVFEGHTHYRYMLEDRYGVKHIQCGGYNDGISHAAVTVNYANGVSTTDVSFVLDDEYAASSADGIIGELMQKYSEEIGDPDRVVGYNSATRSANELRQRIAELYYSVGTEKWGSSYEIVLGGGYISVRSPKKLPIGSVTVGQIQTLFPFDNEIVLCSVSGERLRSQFFETGNSNYFIAYGEYGESVKKGIDDSKTYYIVTDRYTADYAPNGLTVVERYDAETFARDLMCDFIAAGGYN